ncbi:alpha/beta fold hydrolase [Hymenobacter defluvii]|uniref:Alpha/beta fold hydrolase n=1 Tax=Hymenobacter defluvii TaxID=2054411 RepID=A0ABS3TD25_9BACT|nr:alpha/beta fold hydrolase [Hymenobacter defluvii]MBO3271548.1 alpha/beta fold hydrolase [Hymenobacter defluvii]
MKTTLHFQRYGSGPRVVLAFHGYGQGHGHWRSLVSVLGEQRVSVYAFDLFYHGQSRLSRTDAPLTKQRLGELLADFLREQQIDTFGLLAFSMGAKFALTAAERFPEKVEQLWLLAPDGLQRQFWYSLATTPPFMRNLLGRTVLRPQRLLGFIDSLRQRRLVDAGLVRFAEWQLDSREKRLRIYRSWVGFRKLTFSLKALARLLNKRPTPVTFFLGRHDQVIPHAGLQQFIATLTNARTVLLDTGHAGLIYEVAAYVHRHPEAQW